MDLDAFLPGPKVDARYGITSMTRWRWENEPDLAFPTPIIIGGRKFWRLRDLMAWEQRPGSKRTVPAGKARQSRERTLPPSAAFVDTANPRPPPAGPLLTIRAVADRLNVHERTVRRWIKSSELQGYRFRRQVRIAETDLAAFLVARQTD